MTSMTMPAGALPQAEVYGEPRLHTDADLLALAFGSDRSLWSVEEAGILRRWNAVTGVQVEWQALSDLETLWAFSPDGRYLASASDDLTLWDVTSGHLLATLHHDSWVTALAFSADAAYVATGHDDGVIRYWDASNFRLVHEFRAPARAISALAISIDGTMLAAAAEDKAITLWETETGLEIGALTGHTDRIPALAFHPKGDVLVSAGWDTTARVWDVRTQEPVILLNTHNAQVTSLAFNRDGSRLASADSGLTVHIWDFNAKKTLHQLEGPQGEIRCLAFSQDGRKLAASGACLIHLWDTATGQAQAGSGPRPVAKTSVAVSRNGRWLASNGGGSAPRVWDTASKKALFELEKLDAVHDLAYAPDGRLIAGAARDHIRLWEAATGKVMRDLTDLEEPVTTLGFSADGGTLATGSNTGLDVWLWRVADGEPILIIDDAVDGCTVETLAFHPNGHLLAVGGIDWMATGGSNGAISIWDIDERAEIAVLVGGTNSIAFHPSGKYLASATLDHSICIWDTETHEIQAELTGHEDNVNCVAYSPDGRWLASGGVDRTIRLWDEDGEEASVIELDSQITALVFSPDGQFLYTANANTTCSQFKLSDLLASGGLA